LRIEWARDGLLVRTANSVQIVDESGAVRHIPVNRPALDARWLSDGTVIAFDAIGMLRWHRIDGEVVDQRTITFNRAGRDSAIAASIAGDGQRIAIVATSDVENAEQVGVWSADDERVWTFKPARLGIGSFAGNTTALLSNDGRRIAVGYETLGGRFPHSQVAALTTRRYHQGIGSAPKLDSATGRGWLVCQVVSEEVLDRNWIETPRDDGAMVFAFDRRGRRFVHASPERIDDVGPIRVDGSGTYTRNRPGGARCVAFDPHGVMVAYGYREPPAGARGRVVVDYLARSLSGASMIEIVETLSIDPGVDVASIAFSPDSRRIACLGSDGALEIVPVP
jgi:hypothetical protein